MLGVICPYAGGHVPHRLGPFSPMLGVMFPIGWAWAIFAEHMNEHTAKYIDYHSYRIWLGAVGRGLGAAIFGWANFEVQHSR
jgi:hypothetical protein